MRRQVPLSVTASVSPNSSWATSALLVAGILQEDRSPHGTVEDMKATHTPLGKYQLLSYLIHSWIQARKRIDIAVPEERNIKPLQLGDTSSRKPCWD